jgi:hypothetical protein
MNEAPTDAQPMTTEEWAAYHLDLDRQASEDSCHACGEMLRYCTPKQQEANFFCRKLCIGHCDQCHVMPTYKLFGA